jgi:NADH-quinone oxidoreductase subunit N
MDTMAWLLLSPILVACASALAALIADALVSPRAAVLTAAVGLTGSAVLSALVVPRGIASVFDVLALGGTPSAVGAVSFGIAALVLLAGRRRATWPHAGQIAALVAFSAAASAALAGVFDLGVFVVLIELVSLAGYALVASARTTRSYEAAMKYFVQGAVATGLLAYGIAVLFGSFGGGSLRYGDLAKAVAAAPGSPAVTTAIVLLLAGLAFKLGAFPFHSWAPDAYETAPPFVAAYLATVPKLAALLATVMLLLNVFAGPGAMAVWQPLVAGLAVASIVFGNLGALKQTSFRRMLAYSGIAQVGYALVAVAAGVAPVILLFGLLYAVAATGAFLAAEAAGEGAAWDGTIAGLAGLGRRRPLLGASLAVCLLSLTGIPLTAGFWGKFLVFSAAAGTNLLWLAIVGVIGSVVSFGYYGGVLRAVYLDDTAEAPEPEPLGRTEPALEEVVELAPRSVGAMAADDGGEPAGAGGSWAVAVIAALILIAGIAPLFGGLAVFNLLGS